MKAVVAPEPGGPEALQVVDLPDPEPGPGELLVAVAATAVNRADVLQRRGMYPPPPGAPDTLGLELAGTVAALGEGVEGWSVGDEVCAVVGGGGYASLAVVPASTAMPLPPGLDVVTAAAVPEVFTTAWDALVLQAGLSEGETALLHGGSSGVGTAGIQLAAMVGARSVVTVGTVAKADACTDLGAEVAINYKDVDDFAEAITDALGHGVDVLLDIIGGDYLARNLQVLRTGGRMVTIGLMGGVKAELNMGLLMGKRLTLRGSTLRARPLEEKAEVAAAVVADVWPGFADGRLRPIVQTRYALDDVAEAHAELEASDHIGKILLTL